MKNESERMVSKRKAQGDHQKPFADSCFVRRAALGNCHACGPGEQGWGGKRGLSRRIRKKPRQKQQLPTL